jgi:radical SAM superfamily enzyme YgiQ (UPF0313 family)
MSNIILINPGSNLLEKGLVLDPLEREMRELQLRYGKEKLISLGIELREVPLYSYQISRGLLCIAAKLIEEGFKPIYLQMDYEKEQNPGKNIAEILKPYVQKADIVGITAYTFNFDDAVEIAKVSKSVNPEIEIVLGGPHVTYLDVETLDSPYIDVIVRGEGENVFRDLCKALLNRNGLKDLRGITYKRGREIKRNPPASLLKSEEIPIPSYSLIRSIENPSIVIETTRGCPMHCLFCAESAFWEKIRYRKIDDVVEEIKIIKSLFGYNAIHICDPYFPINKQYAKELLYKIKNERIEMHFNCNIRFDRVNTDILELLLESNFYEVFVGIESGSDKVLKEMRKGFSFNQCYLSLREIREYIPLIASAWMVGHPGEDKNTIKETIEKIKLLLNEGLIDKIWPKIFIPYPGTGPFHFPEKYGVEILTKGWDNYFRSSFPVHRLIGVSEKQIYEGYKMIVKLVVEWFRQKI